MADAWDRTDGLAALLTETWQTWSKNSGCMADVKPVEIEELIFRFVRALEDRGVRLPGAPERRYDSRREVTLCEETYRLAIKGSCPEHGGDACLHQYAPALAFDAPEAGAVPAAPTPRAAPLPDAAERERLAKIMDEFRDAPGGEMYVAGELRRDDATAIARLLRQPGAPRTELDGNAIAALITEGYARHREDALRIWRIIRGGSASEGGTK